MTRLKNQERWQKRYQWRLAKVLLRHTNKAKESQSLRANLG
ncbi:MAG: hypothetical protein AAFO96_29470 [Bacteroidota bacterium]